MSDTDHSPETAAPVADTQADAPAQASGGAPDFTVPPTIAEAEAWIKALEADLTAGTSRHIDARDWGEEASDTAGIAVLLSAFKTAETARGALTIALPEEGGFHARLNAFGLTPAQLTRDDNGHWNGLAA